MGNTICPKGMKLVPGRKVGVAPREAKIKKKANNVCSDTSHITNKQYDKFIGKKCEVNIFQCGRLTENEKSTQRVTGMNIENARRFCKSRGKRLPSAAEAYSVMKSGVVKFVNSPHYKTIKNAAYTWFTASGWRLGYAPAVRGGQIIWVKDEPGITSDASFFCVADLKKK